MRVASNSSPIIWLSQTGHFDLLREVFGTILITPEVWAETLTAPLATRMQPTLWWRRQHSGYK